jgi:hypothetical protein
MCPLVNPLTCPLDHPTSPNPVPQTFFTADYRGTSITKPPVGEREVQARDRRWSLELRVSAGLASKRVSTTFLSYIRCDCFA